MTRPGRYLLRMLVFLAVVLGVVVLLAMHIRNLWRLIRWLRQPTPETVPEARGPWGDAFLSLFRLQRKAEHGSELLREALTRWVAGSSIRSPNSTRSSVICGARRRSTALIRAFSSRVEKGLVM